jgi:large subunit ribosomal protein L4
VFGPHPRNHTKKLPRKVKRLALRSSLTTRANDGDIMVVNSLKFDEPRTSQFAGMLKNMNVTGKTLVVLNEADTATIKSARNIAGVRVTLADMVTTYDVVWADKIVIASDAVQKMEEVFAS